MNEFSHSQVLNSLLLENVVVKQGYPCVFSYFPLASTFFLSVILWFDSHLSSERAMNSNISQPPKLCAQLIVVQLQLLDVLAQQEQKYSEGTRLDITRTT